MISDTAQVLAAALKLPREARTAVVDELMRSLDDAEDLIDAGESPEDAGDRERLHAAIARSEEQFRAGQGVPAEVVLDRLTKR